MSVGGRMATGADGGIGTTFNVMGGLFVEFFPGHGGTGDRLRVARFRRRLMK
jgi:dihydrodipicolinate synthase/N-acetylneuraminate lyase